MPELPPTSFVYPLKETPALQAVSGLFCRRTKTHNPCSNKSQVVATTTPQREDVLQRLANSDR